MIISVKNAARKFKRSHFCVGRLRKKEERKRLRKLAVNQPEFCFVKKKGIHSKSMQMIITYIRTLTKDFEVH